MSEKPEGAINRMLRLHTPWYVKLGVKLGLLAPPAHPGRRTPEADAQLITAFILAGNQVFKGTTHDTATEANAG